MTWLDRPILVLDMETDGLDPMDAHPVQICLGVSAGAGHWDPHKWLIRPTRPIQGSATAVHGITTEHATAHGIDISDALKEMHGIAATFPSAPVLMHNAPYDWTILTRIATEYPWTDRSVLDTLVLHWRFDRSVGGRSLTALADRSGIIFPAHDAEADSFATLRILHILAGREDALPYLPPESLHILQARWYGMMQDQVLSRAAGGRTPIEVCMDWPMRTESSTNITL